ncbi:hypothetical protein D5R81_05730 [Parashewanella spongiae]|uniref:Uncharacterized protein n=1 Tax=Parashewanella spongiae TaxID=342950 RepID=A0A3A6U2X7_9GAMM|nr:hypothetical protein [Parashewanella spongiae]MCL1077416.1 hypothetical protein [Parashewanella spongiae]RJY18367.1 hypothetical protein D5R81_05730 [Parashewanella spongiae]
MATVRTSAEQQSIYIFMLKSLQEYPSEAVSYLNFEVSWFDDNEELQQGYQRLSKVDRQKLYDFFNNKSSSTRSDSRTREAHYRKKPSNARQRFSTEPFSNTPKSSTRYTKQIQQPPSSVSFFTQTSELIHSWKLKQKTKNQLGIELNALIFGCTKLSQLIEIIRTLKNDKIVMEASWDIRSIHKLLHKAAEFSGSHSSNFDGIFSDIIRFKSSYEAKTCTLLLKLIKLNLNFSDGKRLVLGNAAETSIMQQWGIMPDVAVYNAFITVCAKTGQFDSAWQLVCGDKPVMAPYLPLKANHITCVNLLTACAEMKRYAEAKSLVLGDGYTATDSLMQRWGIKPNVAIYSAFITVCAKTGQFDSAWQLVCGDKLVMAPHLPLKANQITCMNLLSACAEMDRYAEAKSLVLGDTTTVTASLMQQWRIKPNVAIYNAFIRVCAKTSQFDSAWQLVCGDKPVMTPYLPLKADKITCLNLLTACAEAGRYAEAKSLVLGDGNTTTASLMQQWGIKPDVAIYNAFITVCAKTGQFDSAWQLVCGDKPVMAPHLLLKANQITCMNLLTACAEARRYAKAKSLVLGDGDTTTASLMQQWGIKPDVAIYNAFITVCAKTGQFDSAWQLVCGDKSLMAPHLLLKANQITCTNLLTACAETGRYAEAKSLVLGDGNTATISFMQQWGIKPDVAIYNAFITVCAKTDQFNSAWQLVCGDKSLMAPHLSLKANKITCINLLTACAELERYAEAKSLVLGDGDTDSLMQQWGIKPDVGIYSAFITVCARTDQFDSAWQLTCGGKPVMAPHLPLKANQITCTNLLTACAETGRYAEAKSLVLGDGNTVSLMQRWGIKPNVPIYCAFIMVCAKTSQFDSAWQLVCGDKPVMAPHLPLKADSITCINLLRACAETGRYAEAKSLVLGDGDKTTASLMQQWDIKPDAAVYSAFITVCAKTGQFDSAWQLVCGDKPVMAPHLPLKADKITCINLLTACAEVGRYAEAKSLVLGDGNTTTTSLMQQWGIKPNVAIYNAFITVCAKTGQFDSAWQLVCGDKPVMAPHLSLKACQITCMNLLTACAEAGRYAEAKSLVLGDGDTDTTSLMKQWGIKPDVAIYNAFIKVCIKAKEFDAEIWYLEKIMNECNMSTPSQIHAQLAPLEKDNFASMIDKGITQGIYKKNVGLMNHCIDLHMDKIFEGHSDDGTHIRGVPLAFAKLLFCYHKQNNEPKITSIITGYHGNNTLKNGMISFLKDEFELEFIEDRFNSGRIVLSESTH